MVQKNLKKKLLNQQNNNDCIMCGYIKVGKSKIKIDED